MEREAERALQDLMTRLASGDRSAFRPVFEQVRPIVERFAARGLASEADAEDAAQQALIKVFARASSFDPSRDALAWILTLTTYEIRTIRKKHQRRREETSEALAAVAGGGPTPEAQVLERELLEGLLEVLGTMRAADAEAILAGAALIERPSVAPATFRKRLQRAMERLKDAWGAGHEQ